MDRTRIGGNGGEMGGGEDMGIGIGTYNGKDSLFSFLKKINKNNVKS